MERRGWLAARQSILDPISSLFLPQTIMTCGLGVGNTIILLLLIESVSLILMFNILWISYCAAFRDKPASPMKVRTVGSVTNSRCVSSPLPFLWLWEKTFPPWIRVRIRSRFLLPKSSFSFSRSPQLALGGKNISFIRAWSRPAWLVIWCYMVTRKATVPAAKWNKKWDEFVELWQQGKHLFNV